MPIWIMATAVASIVITGLLTWLLWRLNAPMRVRSQAEEPEGDGGN
jgi:hypothetical protein